MGKYTNKLVNARVLVLGGTSGIGYAVAEAAVDHGAFVIVSSSNPKKIQATIEQLQKSYPDSSSKVIGFPCDLGNPATLESNVENLLKKATNDGKDKLDHVVFTAGDFPMNLNNTLSEINVETIIKWSTTRIFGNAMVAKHLPNYINMTLNSSYTLTSGVASMKPLPGLPILSGVSGNLESLTRAFAVELVPLRVNCVSPGAILTEEMHKFGDIEVLKKQWSSANLTEAMGLPEDIAELYIYFMKDKNVTGTVTGSDGGTVIKSR